jgi:hypothetical protein
MNLRKKKRKKERGYEGVFYKIKALKMAAMFPCALTPAPEI